MRKFWGLTKRNLLVFFKDKTMIFFSMLTPLIIFILYLLFLRGTYIDVLESSAELLMNAGLVNMDDLGAMANGLLLTGIMGSALITIPYNCLITLVNDRAAGIDVDVTATPVSRLQIILSYFAASAISAVLMTSVILGAGLVVLQFTNPTYLTAKSILTLFAILVIGAISATAVFMTFMLFLKSSSASGAFLGILSAGCGFVIGAYMPIASFSTAIQNFCHLFPATGITILIRRYLLSDLLTHVDANIGGIDQGMFVGSIQDYFSFSPKLLGHVLSLQEALLYVMMVTVGFLVAIGIIYPRIYKRK
ncbi:MAG: ABC transporter permease [Lachnospiraceae bacterium]|nr:ABC transporter permease [Lachnospiraceae bacterium]MBR4607178.1 ABC transporter permease [Lachnospiraceae bacterium]MBR6149748.1 ABC transporter permease [Lachnospiraceae bacterium]